MYVFHASLTDFHCFDWLTDVLGNPYGFRKKNTTRDRHELKPFVFHNLAIARMVRLTQPEILNNIHNCASKSRQLRCLVRCVCSTASVYDVKRHIKSKLHEKNAKFTV